MKIFLLLIFTTIQSLAFSQSLVKVVVPSVEQETDYLWRTLQDLPLLDRFGYEVVWPTGDLIEELKGKARKQSLSDADYQALLEYMKSTLYKPGDYSAGRERVSQATDLLNDMINRLRETPYDWSFRHYKQYRVLLTLYGPGGSYDPENGTILLFTTRQGGFKQYSDPACTIIHEIVHMGIEEAIINRYEVPHPMKERIVDTFVTLNFERDLPEYRRQDMGEYRTDPYLQEVQDLKQLDQVVSGLLNP